MTVAVVLQRIKEADLKLHSKKCHLFQCEAIFLDHRVTQQGTSSDPQTIHAVQAWMRPRKVSKVGAFVQGFSKSAAPLHQLTVLSFFYVNLELQGSQHFQRY